MATKKTVPNTKPSEAGYLPTELYAIIGELGKKFLEMQQVLNTTEGSGMFDHREYMWIGDVPLYYEDEVFGYLSIEDDIVNFHEAELENKS